MDPLTPAAPWVALLLAVVALVVASFALWRTYAMGRDVISLANNVESLADNVADLALRVASKADKRPARKPTPLADSERLLAASSKAEGA